MGKHFVSLSLSGHLSAQMSEQTLLVSASRKMDVFDQIETLWTSDLWLFDALHCPALFVQELLPDLAQRKEHIREKRQAQEKKFKELGIFRDSIHGDKA